MSVQPLDLKNHDDSTYSLKVDYDPTLSHGGVEDEVKDARGAYDDLNARIEAIIVGGGGAPVGAQYLTLATDPTLTSERVLVPGTGLSGSDGGAGGNYTLSTDDSEINHNNLLNTHNLTSDLTPPLNNITNPTGDKTFAMTNRQLAFLWTTPTGNPVEFEASGAYTGALVHIHQHTGNPGSMYLLELEATDSDVEHIKSIGIAATTEVLGTYVSGDSDDRFALFSDGKMEWGPGSGAADTNLYRTAADNLKTDDALDVGGLLKLLGNIEFTAAERVILTQGSAYIGDDGAGLGFLRLISASSVNYLQSVDTTKVASQNLEISGYGGAQMTALTLDAATTTATGQVTISRPTGSGQVLLLFDMERDWQFQTEGVGASQALTLISNNTNKYFNINTDGLFRVRAHDSTVGAAISPTIGSLNLYGPTPAVGFNETGIGNYRWVLDTNILHLDYDEGADGGGDYGAYTRASFVGAANSLTLRPQVAGELHIGDATYRVGDLYSNRRFSTINTAVSTTSSWYPIYVSHSKTAGATNYSDFLEGIHVFIEMNDSDAQTSHFRGIDLQTKLTAGEVGATGNARHMQGIWNYVDIDGGTVWGDFYGLYTYVDIESASTLKGNVYGHRIWMDVDEDPDGTVYQLYLSGGTNIDYGVYQVNAAPNFFEGDLETAGELKGSRTSFVVASATGISGVNWYMPWNDVAGTAKGMVMPRAGSIVGLSVMYDVDTWQKTVSIQVRKNGTEVWNNALSATGAGNEQTDYFTQARNTDTFAAGDDIQISMSQASGVPYTSIGDVIVTLEVVYDT